ncbi:DoxX family protein [Kribbella sp.]|uniref:DoxX family protein n=1 Tax=Kribbella sp. TaxID=1871183 RepID=UPI002D382661|nr:DoxX family protein [Kribbella sp.]HZX02825.1 DoxX family protein [Kribbella sp.]
MDVGLLVLHAVVGLLMAGHGGQKLFGWFDGHGLRGTAEFVEKLGWRPGRAFALLLGASELAGGLGLTVGFATPLAAAAIIAVLANAAWVVHRPHGLWNNSLGYEYPLALVAAAASLAFTGPGRYSLDQVLGWSLSGIDWGVAALALGALGWLLGSVARHLKHGSPAGQPA